jgi:hypothetical protein
MTSKILGTQTIEQLTEAVAISEEAWTAVQEPGGKINKLRVARLLGKLISTNAAKTTRALLLADLAFAENSIALVFADPDPALNGWYRKTGVSGAGTWTQFEALALSARDVAVAASANAVAAQAAAAQLLSEAGQLEALVRAEFANGAVGGLYLTNKANLYRDTALTTPVTAVGQDVAAIKDVLIAGSSNRDLIQADAGERGIYMEAYGMGFVRMVGGQGYHSRAQVPLTAPSFLAMSAKYQSAVDGRYLFGFNKNTNSRHVLASASNGRVEGGVYGDALDILRPWVQAFTADFATPPGPVGVYHSLLADGFIDALFEDNQFTNANIRKATAFANGDTINNCWLVLNATSNANNNSDTSVDFYGGMAMSAKPQQRLVVSNWLQGRSRPMLDKRVRHWFINTDSTGDNTITGGGYGMEAFRKIASAELPSRNPGTTITSRDFNTQADGPMGVEAHTDPGFLKRLHMTIAGRAGANPDFMIGDRFDKHFADLPAPELVIHNGGHNLPVTDAVIFAHAKRYLYRMGHIMGAQEFYRAAWPKARQVSINPYPYGVPGDDRILPYNEALEAVAARYGDMPLVPLKTHWAARNAAWYHGDKVHPTDPVGVAEMVGPTMTVLDALDLNANVTPAILRRRARVAASAQLLQNCDFSQWAGGLPVNWTLFGDGDVDQIGPQALVSSTANGGIQQVIDCTALQNQTVCLLVVQEVQNSVNIHAGGVSFLTNGAAGAGGIGDGRWFNSPLRVYGRESGFIHHFPIPADATQLTVRLFGASNFGGSVGAGSTAASRLILVTGEEPRDLLGAPEFLP